MRNQKIWFFKPLKQEKAKGEESYRKYCTSPCIFNLFPNCIWYDTYCFLHIDTTLKSIHRNTKIEFWAQISTRFLIHYGFWVLGRLRSNILLQTVGTYIVMLTSPETLKTKFLIFHCFCLHVVSLLSPILKEEFWKFSTPTKGRLKNSSESSNIELRL